RAGIANNRPSAERPWTEFHPALHQPNHLAFGQIGSNGIRQVAASETSRVVAPAVKPRTDLVVRERRPEKRSLHGIRVRRRLAGQRARLWSPRPRRLRARARLFQVAMPQAEGDADCAASVASGWLDPDFVKRSFAHQASVCDAVERHAAGETQVPECRFAVRE